MSLRGIASLGFKLLGIFVIIQAVPLLRDIGFVISSLDLYVSTGIDAVILLSSIILPIVLLVGIGSSLFIFSYRLASRVVTPGAEVVTTPDVDRRDIQAVAFSVIGVLVFVLAVPKLFQIGANYYGIKQLGQDVRAELFWKGTWVYAMGLFVQMLLGLGLFLGARGLSNIWHRLEATRPMRRRDDAT